MASIELLRVRAFARGDPANRSQIETAARVRAQSAETIRTCRATVSDSKALLDRLKADRAASARAWGTKKKGLQGSKTEGLSIAHVERTHSFGFALCVPPVLTRF
jgi:hypothetical protein